MLRVLLHRRSVAVALEQAPISDHFRPLHDRLGARMARTFNRDMLGGPPGELKRRRPWVQIRTLKSVQDEKRNGFQKGPETEIVDISCLLRTRLRTCERPAAWSPPNSVDSSSRTNVPTTATHHPSRATIGSFAGRWCVRRLRKFRHALLTPFSTAIFGSTLHAISCTSLTSNRARRTHPGSRVAVHRPR